MSKNVKHPAATGREWWLGIGAVIALASYGGAMAQSRRATLRLSTGSKVWLDGDSTLHKYRIDARQVEASFTLTPGASPATPEKLIRSGAVKGLEVTIPVQALTSGESGLDDNLRKSLHAGIYPDIIWRMSSYEVVPPEAPGAILGLNAVGQLTVAGVERPVSLSLQAFPASSGLRLTGDRSLSMKEFGVVAPVLLLGAIKTADGVRIGLDLMLQSSAG